MSPLQKKRLTIHFQTTDINKSIITIIKSEDTYNFTFTLCNVVFLYK